MRKLMLICLLAVSAAAVAQAPPPGTAGAQKRGGKASEVADLERSDPKSAEDEAKMRAELDAAKQRLDEAAREVARLSTQLGRSSGHEFVMLNAGGPPRAVLGVQIDADSASKDGARVAKVSPGGAAAEAGLQDGDIIVALDDDKIAGSANPNRAVVEHMRKVKPDQKVKVKVQRAGKNKDFVVVARPMVFANQRLEFRSPDMNTGPMTATVVPGFPGMPAIRQFRMMWPGEFGGMELASITPKLGAYFGATDGVLVVQAPDNAAFKLEDGDVIQAIDGRKPEDGAHAMRILRSYKSGEKLNLSVLRQRKALTLAVTMPERPEFEDRMMDPPMPPEPPVPSIPSGAGVPGSGATFE